MAFDSLLAGAGLADARFVGWRVILLAAKEPVAAVEFTSVEGAVTRFKSYHQGPSAKSIDSAIALIERLPQVKTRVLSRAYCNCPLSIYWPLATCSR